MNSRRRILIAVGLGLCVLLVLIVALKQHSSRQAAHKPTASHLVNLTNANQYLNTISQPDIKSIESTLYDKTVTTLPKSNSAGSFAGVVRQNSYQQSSTVYSDGVTQIPVYSFMVDIPSVKRSFSVALSGGRQYPFDTLYVLCPTTDQLIYAAFSCQDPSL